MTPTGPPIVVVGDVAVDVVTRVRGPIAWHSDSPSDIRLTAGGAGANTAAWIAHLGGHAVLVARVGADASALAARQTLTEGGVECRFAVDDRLPTGVVLSLVETDGERSLFADRGANSALTPADVDLGFGGHGAAHLHLSGYVLADPGSRAAGLAALAQGRELGWTTSFDPQAASLVREVGAGAVLGWIGGVDLVLPNAAELDALGGVEAVVAAGHEVVVTDGVAGARWHRSDGEPITCPAVGVPVVDATGCGDAFSAGLLVTWLATHDRDAALASGVAAGTAAAGQVGAHPQT